MGAEAVTAKFGSASEWLEPPSEDAKKREHLLVKRRV